jgi:hypothetical protein
MTQRHRNRLKPEFRCVVRPPSVWDYIKLECSMGALDTYDPSWTYLVLDVFTAYARFGDDLNSIRVIYPARQKSDNHMLCEFKMGEEEMTIF